MSAASDAQPASDSGHSDTADDRTPLYRLAYDQSIRALNDQTDEWNGIRGRVATFMALVASATAFLAGTVLKDVKHDTVFHWLASLASAGSVIALLATGWALIPKKWQMRSDARVFIEEWIEGSNPVPDEAAMLREITLAQERVKIKNERVLKSLRRMYAILIFAGSVGIGFWTALAWVRG